MRPDVDELYMRRAMELARRATHSLTSPNPLVGACIVRKGRLAGEGYHQRLGWPHAEANALEEAGSRARGATLYVTLEPCDHFGRTPPCTDAIIKGGIRKVVIGMKDPNPINNGRGIRKLARHGITVRCGLLEKEVRSINKPYVKFITERMPYVTVKVAQSLDGKIATKTGDSRWITSPDARRYVHALRADVDAIMVGVNTVIRDDPRLTVREIGHTTHDTGHRKPWRVIVDSTLRTPLDARVFASCPRLPLLIATRPNASMAKRRMLERRGAQVLAVKSRGARVDLARLLGILAEREITHILVEGGGELIAGLIEKGLADRILCFIAPKIIGGVRAPTAVEGAGAGSVAGAVRIEHMRLTRFERDLLVEGEIRRCSPGS